MSKTIQVQKIIRLARRQGKFTTQEVILMGITQQNARIHDARKKLGCTHADRDALPGHRCTAIEHIICVKDNHYEYVDSSHVRVPVFNPLQARTELPGGAEKLKGPVLKKWQKIGAYLRGERKTKPKIFSNQIMEALV